MILPFILDCAVQKDTVHAADHSSKIARLSYKSSPISLFDICFLSRFLHRWLGSAFPLSTNSNGTESACQLCWESKWETLPAIRPRLGPQHFGALLLADVLCGDILGDCCGCLGVSLRRLQSLTTDDWLKSTKPCQCTLSGSPETNVCCWLIWLDVLSTAKCFWMLSDQMQQLMWL